MPNVNVKDFMRSVPKFTLKSKAIMFTLLGVLTAVTLFIAFYFGLVPFNLSSGSFKFLLVVLLLIWSIPLIVVIKDKGKFAKVKSGWGAPLFVAGGLVVLYILMAMFTSPLFMSKQYRELISVTKSDNFSEVENYDTMKIPVVDYDLALKLGDKTLGDGNLGSQFVVKDYTMISYANDLYWVAPLEYKGFFQWTSAKRSPGYIKIKATVTDDVDLIKQELRFTDSAYFSDDLQRQMYFGNMHRYREGKPRFELDDEGKPMFVESVIENKFAFTSGADPVGVIITDAVSGATKFYNITDAPKWVDRVMPASIIYEQLTNWGKYSNGFFNTLFAKKDMLRVSTGYNYIYSNKEMYFYTGFTSINADESIVGVSLVNMRTKDTKFYNVVGATESAAARSAEGFPEVQAANLKASDPILINYNGEPTYFMTLKDKAGLIKMYAYVNVKEFSKGAANVSQEVALKQYATAIGKEPPTADENENVTVTVKNVLPSIVIDGTTHYVFSFNESKFANKLFVAPIKLNINMMTVKAGDTLVIDYLEENDHNIITKMAITPVVTP